jgi:hypothetical protein
LRRTVSPRFAGRAAILMAALVAPGVLVRPGVAHAGKADAVERLVAVGKADQAREKCDKMEVRAPWGDRGLFEACAQAFWIAVEADGSSAAWAAYRQRFQGASTMARARVEEADAVVRELDPRTPEEQLLVLAERYKGTPGADAMAARAGDAAVRDTRSADAAVRAARRYPTHPDLPTLVEAWPDAFLVVDIDGRRVDVRTEPPVRLTGDFSPRVTWVAREPGGAAEDWDRATGEIALQWGVPEGTVAGRTRGGEPPTMPLCTAPDQPPGWGPFVEVAVGKGVVYKPVRWDEGCGPDAWPVFLSYSRGQVAALSLRPGHAVDLASIATPEGRRHVRGFLVLTDRAPRLEGNLLYQETETAWIVTPLSGGAPWATRSGPTGAAVPLGKLLKSAGLPEGWSADKSGREYRVSAPALARLPPSIRDWRLPDGELRVPPPLVRDLIGLLPSAAQPPAKPAPALGDQLWKRGGGGEVLRDLPDGAAPAGLYRMEPADLDAAQGLLRGVGFPDDWVTLLDGWKADVDTDGEPELVIRAEVDGVGTLFVADLVQAGAGRPGAPARVFAVEAPRVRADSRIADMPFAFRRGEFVYLAWGGAETLGTTRRRHFVQVVRFDGTGFVLDDISLK